MVYNVFNILKVLSRNIERKGKFNLQLIRSVSVAVSLKYNQFGEPSEVVNLCNEEVDDPKENEVLVKIIAAPINPADINTIQGKYPVKPKFPAIGGNEFVGEVVSIGQTVNSLRPGDRVVPFTSGLGTWRSLAKYSQEDLMKISKKIGIPEAATITVNPCTAYRMLKDFITLTPGDTIIQNGANSAVGQAVHQFSKAWGINSVGVVRDRPDIEELRKYLKGLGATEVLTESEIRTTKIFESQLKKPMLGFNCVGGKSANEISKHLANNGCLITYGGMSREPVTISAASLIFKDISFRGFWMTRWTKENYQNSERSKMFDDICKMIEAGLFKGPLYEMVSVNEFKTALSQAANFSGFTGKKFILTFRNNSGTAQKL